MIKHRYLDNANAIETVSEKQSVELYLKDCKKKLDEIKKKQREERLKKKDEKEKEEDIKFEDDIKVEDSNINDSKKYNININTYSNPKFFQ